VYVELQRQIADGELEPGAVMRDVAIAEQMGVGRTPVREALQMLVHMGAVTAHRGFQTIVASADIKDVGLVYPVLATLHGLAASQATRHVDDEAIAALVEANVAVRAAAEASDFLRARAADRSFHDLVLNLSRNRFLVAALAPVNLHARRLDGLFMAEQGPTLDSVEQHRQCIEAMRLKQPWVAQRLMEAHWLQPIARAAG
jgi:DNA-binding GntR family transcriptional regulator